MTLCVSRKAVISLINAGNIKKNSYFKLLSSATVTSASAFKTSDRYGSSKHLSKLGGLNEGSEILLSYPPYDRSRGTNHQEEPTPEKYMVGRIDEIMGNYGAKPLLNEGNGVPGRSSQEKTAKPRKSTNVYLRPVKHLMLAEVSVRLRQKVPP